MKTPPTPPEPPPPTPTVPGATFFPCRQCGAKLQYAPGTTHLKCPYCTAENAIAKAQQPVQERDYLRALAALERAAPHADSAELDCQGCHAVLTVAENIKSLACPFCGSNIVRSHAGPQRLEPNAVLPFQIDGQRATDAFRTWIRSRWFAPGRLKRQSLLDAAVSGVYIPAWTFDTLAHTTYTGQRGDAYYETRTVTVNGRRQTQRVRKIRWSPRSGRVRNTFDDILVLASESLPRARAERLEPWDLTSALPYAEAYLAGFRAECYQLPLDKGFVRAQEIMQPQIEGTIRADIGGDEQRITSADSRYEDIRFKYILLPVWVSAYRFNGRLYQFLVNARTGEVSGERPWSAIKIALAALAALALIGLAVMLYMRFGA